MAGRRQQQSRQQPQPAPLSPPQLQAISVAVADAVTQALQCSSPQPGLVPTTASASATAGEMVSSFASTHRWGLYSINFCALGQLAIGYA